MKEGKDEKNEVKKGMEGKRGTREWKTGRRKEGRTYVGNP